MTQLHFESDIPFYWTAIFHWLSYMAYISLLPKRFKAPGTVLLSLLFLPVQIAIYQVIAPLRGMPFNAGVALFSVWTLFPFIVLNETTLLNRIYYCARAFILGGFSVSFAWQIYHYYAMRHYSLFSKNWEILITLGLGLFVILLVYFLERRHKDVLSEMNISLRHCLETVAIAVFIYILSSLSYTALDTPFSAESESQVFMIRTIVYFSGSAILYAFHLQLCDLYAKQERDALQRILDQQYENFRVRQESVNLVNQKYHDLKHQIALLRSEIGNEQKVEVLDQLEREIKTYEAQNKTGNEVLDTILTSKSLYCQEHNITMTVVCDGHVLDFMQVMDLSALFGNALDNAIEAVEQIPDPDQRLITLSVSRQKGFAGIQVRNRYLGQPSFLNSLPSTTKKDKRFHGYGLKSIRSTVEKYNGSFTVRGDNGWFEMGILIPLLE